MKVSVLAMLAINALTIDAAPVNNSTVESVDTRGVTPCHRWTEKVGNGNPHQNGYHIQVTDNLECRQDGGCTAGHLTDHTVSYSADFSIAEWISGGFSVTESTSTGSSYSCPGKKGETICVFKNVAHTAYTVKSYQTGDACLSPIHIGPVVVKSPNKDNRGGYYYCASGKQCHFNSYGFWDDKKA